MSRVCARRGIGDGGGTLAQVARHPVECPTSAPLPPVPLPGGRAGPLYVPAHPRVNERPRAQNLGKIPRDGGRRVMLVYLFLSKNLSRSAGVMPAHIPLRRTSGVSNDATKSRQGFRTSHCAQYVRASAQSSSAFPPFRSGKNTSVGAPWHAAWFIHLWCWNIPVPSVLVFLSLLRGHASEHSVSPVFGV